MAKFEVLERVVNLHRLSATFLGSKKAESAFFQIHSIFSSRCMIGIPQSNIGKIQFFVRDARVSINPKYQCEFLAST